MAQTEDLGQEFLLQEFFWRRYGYILTRVVYVHEYDIIELLRSRLVYVIEGVSCHRFEGVAVRAEAEVVFCDGQYVGADVHRC